MRLRPEDAGLKIYLVLHVYVDFPWPLPPQPSPSPTSIRATAGSGVALVESRAWAVFERRSARRADRSGVSGLRRENETEALPD